MVSGACVFCHASAGIPDSALLYNFFH
ncbi:MAG: hypothetical protein ACKVOR_07545 [Flavobacteriales bacterium]